MKKLFTILLSFCFVLPAFAGNVGAINNEAWLEHIAQMQSLRQQIMGLVSKSNPTFEDRDKLAVLKQDFNDRKASWDAYLVEVAEGRAVKPADTTVAPATECSQHVSEKMDCSSKKGCGKDKCKTECCGIAGCSCKDKMHKCNDACKDKCKTACCGVAGCSCKDKMHKCNDACKDKCKTECCGIAGCSCKDRMHKCNDACKDKCKTACCGVAGCSCKDRMHKCNDACKDKCKVACASKKCCNSKDKKMKCGSRKNCKGHGKKDECGKKSEKKSCTPRNAKCGGC